MAAQSASPVNNIHMMVGGPRVSEGCGGGERGPVDMQKEGLYNSDNKVRAYPMDDVLAVKVVDTVHDMVKESEAHKKEHDVALCDWKTLSTQNDVLQCVRKTEAPRCEADRTRQ